MLSRKHKMGMGKKAQTMQGWTEGIAIAVLFVMVFSIVIVGMNDLYSKDHEIEGLPTTDFYDKLKTQQDSMDEKFSEGEASFLGAVGLTVSTSWDVLFGTLTILWQFLTGSWIETIIGYMNMGEIGTPVAYVFRALFFLSIGFIILKILFKIRT